MHSGGEPFSLPRTERRTIETPAGPYRVIVAWPAEAAPPEGYPSIYVLDPHITFATTVESLRARTPRPAATGVRPAVIIGVGYPTSDLQDRSRRMFDCSPPNIEPVDSEAIRDRGPHGVGGAPSFLEALLGPVSEAVHRDWPLAPDQRTLIGHSLSAMFAAYALLTSPDSFRTYVGASPSLWWAPDYFVRLAATLPARLSAGRPSRVLLTVGEYEQAAAPWQPSSNATELALARRSARAMVDRVREFGRILTVSAGQGHRVQTVVIEGEDHVSALPFAISRGIRFGLMG